jgi:hypothetical protein
MTRNNSLLLQLAKQHMQQHQALLLGIARPCWWPLLS